MDGRTLIDAIVRQTTIMIAQLATAGGNRAHLAHTANQVFLDLGAALREQGMGAKGIADMFGMALRTYHLRVQRLSESRTDRGRTLWDAVLEHVQRRGPSSRAEIFERFSYDDETILRSLLRDLVNSGLLYRTGRGDHVRYGVVAGAAAPANAPEQTLADLICLTANRLAPATLDDIANAISVQPQALRPALEEAVRQGRIRSLGGSGTEERFTSEGCVIPLGEAQGWEVAVFDHYQAMVTAVCTKLRKGRQRAEARDLIGGSTFSYTVWEGHPHYQEATRFLAQFREQGAALREKIADYNRVCDEPLRGAATSVAEATLPARAVGNAAVTPTRVKVVVYAGQTLLAMDSEGTLPSQIEEDEDEIDELDSNV
jgi:hypothetical protein